MASNNWEGVSSAFKRERKGSSGALLAGGMLHDLTAHSVVCVAVMLPVDFFDERSCFYLFLNSKRNWTTRTYALPRTWIIGDVFHRTFGGIDQKSIQKSGEPVRLVQANFQ